MRNWGIVVTAFYAMLVLLLLGFGTVLLAEDWWAFESWNQSALAELMPNSLIPAAILVCGQVLLLFLSVDTSWRRLKPQRHAKVTAGLVGIMVTILAFAAMFSIGMAFSGDEFFMNSTFTDMTKFQAQTALGVVVLVVWTFWGVVFYTFSKRSSNVVDSAVSWLIKGSVLELLVAVPCHIIVRQREWCCAQYVSAYGIAAGIAIMLMAFGPSAMFLYKKKLDEYRNRTAT